MAKDRSKRKAGIMAHMSGPLISRAIRTFDRASAIIVLTVWGAALVFMGLAYVGVEQTLKARGDLAEAQAAQPVLPTIAQEPLQTAAIQTIADRVKKRVGEKITLTPTGSQLKIASSSADAYNAWMSAISYIDAISADTQWTVSQFCVGPECRDGLMSVTLNAQKISFVAPPALTEEAEAQP